MHEPRVDRRTFLWVASGAALASCRSTANGPLGGELETELAALERARGGRLGVAVLDTGRGTVRGQRLDERFALCSTFKLVLAAMVLDRAARGEGPLDERLRIAPTDLIAHATVSKAAVDAALARGATAGEATRRELAEAMQTRSDGTASNLLLRDLGGLGAFAAFCRAHGDLVTRLDRFEPEMNDVRPGDDRDTTTPRAMAQLVARLFAGAIAPEAQQTLWQWMVATGTGAARVRAGLPSDWRAGDKTGTGGGTGVTVKCNDVLRIEPPDQAPLVVAVYYDTGEVAEWPSDADEAVLAEVGRIVARHG